MSGFRSNAALLALTLALSAVAPPSARSDLWKTEAQLTEQYGEPVDLRRSLDERTFTFQKGDIRIEVLFVDGLSQELTYRHDERRKPLSTETVESLLQQQFEGKRWHRSRDGKWELEAPATALASLDGWAERLAVVTAAFDQQRTAKVLRELYNPPAEEARSGAEKQFRGVLEFRDEENENRVAIVRAADSVLEVPWSGRNFPAKAKLEPGKTYEITVRDQDSIDSFAPTVFISDRVHRSHSARIEDSESFPLVRIKDGEAVVFDESICELHHVAMDRRIAEIGYGLPALGGCDEKYPHHADWIHGGCFSSESSPKTALHYVCRQCVVACEKYKRGHPEVGR